MTDRNAQRLAWLHSAGSYNVDGYEWGIYRVKWENGRAVEVWQTNADFSDLDAAMGATPESETAPSASVAGLEQASREAVAKPLGTDALLYTRPAPPASASAASRVEGERDAG